MGVNQATAEVFYTAFKALNSNEREASFEKIMSDKQMREDIIDIVLIEQAKKAKGKLISAKEYFAN